MRFLVTASVLLCALVAAPTLANEKRTTGEPATKLAARLWEGWEKQRAKLASGRVRIQGVDTRYATIKAGRLEPDEVTQQQAVDIQLVFDWDSECVKHTIDWGERYRGIWVLAPDRLIEWPDLGKGIIATIDDPDDDRLGFSRFLDPRAVGYTTESEITDERFAVTLEEVAERARTAQEILKSVEELEDGRFRLEYDQPMRGGSDPAWREREVVVINEQQGFTVESRHMTYWKEGFPREPPALRNSAKCRREGEVWVPVLMESYEPQGLSRLTLMFDWKSINQPIPPAEFDAKTCGIPEDTTISDKRNRNRKKSGRSEKANRRLAQ